MSDLKPLRVAIVGAGNWGREHARVLTGRPGVVICAIAGRTPEKTERRAAEFGAKPYTDVDRMLETERPDLVTVSLPNRYHFTATRRVIAAGIPLLVEKPLTFDPGEADTLVAEAEAKQLFFAVNFNHRYAKPVVLAHQAIAAGRVGTITFAHWRFGGEGGADHPFNNLIETQCHGFDMLEHLCGPIDSVAAQMTDVTKPGTFRTVAIALHFSGGAVGTLLGSYDSSYAYPDTHVLEVNGTAGRVLIDDTVRRFTFNKAGSETAEVWQAGYFNDRDRMFYRTFDRHMDAVIAAVRAGSPPPIHARAGRRALSLALACIKSDQTGRRVDVPAADYEPLATPPVERPPANP
jgi:myo-inositol 2-dehydrogenase/D-chiro-inositol 1-dehydrogenase